MRQLGPDFEPSPEALDAESKCFDPTDVLPEIAAVSVSGGSDSMALLRLAHWIWAKADKKIVALTVDHGLRSESTKEAEQVSAWCASLGVEHHILRWQHDGAGNLSAAAREGRYRLMAEFCRAREIEHLYTGHTLDDQAETVLMRFARGSGVDGLAGMARETTIWGIKVVRPLVSGQSRENLRAILRKFGQAWIDDPTNDDPRYDRVKARSLLQQLEPLGISVASLSGLSHRMGLAKRVLQREADKLKQSGLTLSPLGFGTLDVDALATVERETACRVIGETAKLISGKVFRAPLSFEEQLVELALRREKSGGLTSGHCVFRPDGDLFHILREPARCAAKTNSGALSGIWDARFAYDIQETTGVSGLQVGALGEAGLAQIPKDYIGFSDAWLSAAREARLTTPGLWDGDTLVSAPLTPWSADPNTPILRVRTVWPASC